MGDGTHLELFAGSESGWGRWSKHCLVCGRQFDHDVWTEYDRVTDAWGGQARFRCPTEGCAGTASVNYD